MKILELDRKEAREIYNNNYKKMIAQNDGVLKTFTEDQLFRIKKAFNFGRGTINDLQRYINNNRQYCRYYDIEDKRYI